MDESQPQCDGVIILIKLLNAEAFIRVFLRHYLNPEPIDREVLKTKPDSPKPPPDFLARRRNETMVTMPGEQSVAEVE